nr:hypothetical protein [Vibrio vulnificus]
MVKLSCGYFCIACRRPLTRRYVKRVKLAVFCFCDLLSHRSVSSAKSALSVSILC